MLKVDDFRVKKSLIEKTHRQRFFPRVLLSETNTLKFFEKIDSKDFKLAKLWKEQLEPGENNEKSNNKQANVEETFSVCGFINGSNSYFFMEFKRKDSFFDVQFSSYKKLRCLVLKTIQNVWIKHLEEK
jgi:hypothetical protein